MEKVIGYKAYNKGLVNQFHQKFEVNKEYITSGIVWQKEGFHFSEHLEDVLRYYNGFSDIDICVVEGYGNILRTYDEFYDYEIITSSHIRILKVLSQEEIINYAQKLNEHRLCRFISGYKLSEEEIELLTNNQNEPVKKYVRYYQYGDKDAFR